MQQQLPAAELVRRLPSQSFYLCRLQTDMRLTRTTMDENVVQVSTLYGIIDLTRHQTDAFCRYERVLQTGISSSAEPRIVHT
jgi:hypothetical protein